MKTTFLAGMMASMVSLAALPVFAAPLIDEPVDLTLKSGQVLHAAQAKSFSANVVMVKSAEGIQTIAYDQFPDDYQPALNAKRPAKRTDAQIEADREKARKKQPAAAAVAKKRPAADQDFFNGMRIDSYRVNGNLVDVAITNTSDKPQELRPWSVLAFLSNEEVVKGIDFVEVDSAGVVKTILKKHQKVPANATVTLTMIFGKAEKGGTVQKLDWYR